MQIDTNTPAGSLIFTIFSGLAQFERENMLQRQQEGIAIAKAQNKYKGRKPIDIDKLHEVQNLIGEGDECYTSYQTSGDQQTYLLQCC